MLKPIILCFLCLLLAGKVLAGDEARSSRAYASQLVSGSFIQTHDDKFMVTSGFSNYSNRGIIELGLDEDKHVIMSAKTICVKFDVAVTDANLVTTVYSNQQLDINYNPLQQTRYKDKAQLVFQNAYQIKVYNITFNTCALGTACSSCNTPYSGNDAYIQAEISTERFYTFNFSTTFASLDLSDSLTATQQVKINWNYVAGAEEYELEYTYADNYSATLGSYLSAASVSYDLDHDATRISTTENGYKIPLTYEHGYIIYRVRPIGRSTSNERMEGTWAGAPASGNASTTYAVAIPMLNNDALNWQSIKTFAENGRTGTGISYSDALGYERQSLARLNTEQKTIAQSTLYDFYGRPAVSILPGPVSGLDLDYRFELNNYKNSSGLVREFEKRVFDSITVSNVCSTNGFKLDVNSSIGAAHYYSPQNAGQDGYQGYVPDADSLPYSQVKYKPDGTHRITTQSLPGGTHQLGSGKELKYFYAQPTQVELDRLFGSEAPRAAQCHKNYALDPNGQMSATYLDQYGRTLATALLGNSPYNVDSLANLPVSQIFSDTLHLVPTNHKDTADKCVDVNTTFFVADANTPQNFFYKTTLGQFGTSCTPSLCYDCVYNLEISIKDDCGQEIFDYDATSALGYDSIVPPGPYAAGSCGGPTVLQVTGATLNVPVTINFQRAGTYSLHKKICVSDAPMTAYRQAFKNNQVCADPCQYVDSLLNATDFSGCGTQSCADCQQSIDNYQHLSDSLKGQYDREGVPLDSTYTGPVYPEPTLQQLSQWQQSCADLCGPATTCEKYQRMLLADFYPNTGQLAQTNSADPRWANSVMNNTTTLFGGYYWSSPPTGYLNAAGSADYVQVNGSNQTPQSLAEADYIQNYKKSWAGAFLSSHPENCKLYFYCNVLGATLDYDEQMQDLVHYDTVCANTGLIFPLGTLPGTIVAPPASGCAAPVADPIFTSLSGNALVTAFKNELLANLYTNTSQSIYQYVVNQFYSTIPGGYIFGQDECARDAMWTMFRSIYLSKKYALYKSLYADFQGNLSAYGYTGSCSGLPANYSTHFPSWADSLDAYIPGTHASSSMVDSMLKSNSSAAASNFAANLAAANSATIGAACDSACAGYASLWQMNLNAACPAYSAANSTVKSNILTALKGVCKKGCNVNNTGGASSLPGGSYYIIAAGDTARSFQDVLDHYLGASACNALVISQPAPYPIDTAGNNPLGQSSLGSCHCDQLLQVAADFATMQANSTLPAGITQEWQLFRKIYGFDMDDYYALKCFCNSAVASDPANSPWTSGLTWNTTQLNALKAYPLPIDPGFTCPSCLKCSDVVTALGNLVLPSTNTYTGIVNKIKNDSTNTYYALAVLNQQFGVHDLKFYFDLYADCNTFNSGDADTTLTFANNISDEALDLFNYLNELVQNGNLQKNSRALSLCQDDKYYLSTLYGGTLPTISALTYGFATSGTSLSFTITDASLNVLLAVTLTLPGAYAGSWADLLYLDNFVAYCPSPAAGPNYGFKVNATDASFNSVTITGQITNLAFPICQLSPGGSPVPEACPKTAKNINSCAITLMNSALVQGRALFEQQQNNLLAAFEGAYRQHCFEALKETFYRTYKFVREYNYTLYYYDEAGNLQRTVAPNGVVPLSITTSLPASPLQYPLHSSYANGVSQQYVSDYHFNAYNQPVKENTVDGGETNYLYDPVGRLLASQNAKQLAASTTTLHVYSYTLYDAIGRIAEVGEMKTGTNLFATANVNSMVYSSFTSVVSSASSRKQVSNTYYDDLANVPLSANATPYFALTGNAPGNLRNRVVAVTYAEDAANGYDHASYYSYDDHGNVVFAVQENNLLPSNLSGSAAGYNMQFKRMDYTYDLISGNMLQATYQDQQPDQFLHRYFYDADNRLHEVYTSKDKVSWDRDAKYFYYQHGPLARVERADKQVQGMDFYYSLQGWLKGVNSDVLQPDNDAGKDGATGNAYLSNYSKIHAYFAKDAMSFALNYYNSASPSAATMDYQAIKAGSFGNAPTNLDPSSSLTNLYTTNPAFYLDNGTGLGDGPSLYNGNISSMVTSFIDKDPSNSATDNLPTAQLTGYRYDQLHRLTAMKAHRSLNGSSWNAAVSGSNYDDSYRMQLSYDANGNILSLLRHGIAGTLPMDSLDYRYKTIANSAGVNSNQLYGVFDGVSAAAYADDIDAASTPVAYSGSTDRYAYNEIGSLIKDAGEYIASIEWTVDRKVRRIRRDSAAMLAASVTKPDIEYEYNAMRQRVTKIVKPRDAATKALSADLDWQYTYYVYDASGNVMAVYDRSSFFNGSDYTDAVKLAENHLYGSSRLALARPVDPNYALWSYNFSPCGGSGGGINCRTFSTGSVHTPTVPNTDSIYTAARNLGYKEFELDNHLGNVVATVSDRKIILTACPNEFLHDFNTGGTFNPPFHPVRAGLSLTGNLLQVAPTDTSASLHFTYTVGRGDLVNIAFDLGMGSSTAGDSLSATVYPYDSTHAIIGPAYGKIKMNSSGTYNLSFTGSPAGSGYNSLYVEIATKTPSPALHYFDLDNFAIARATGGTPNTAPCSTYVSLFMGYFPDLLMHTDYYAFGQSMPGRQWSASSYRYGMNGQEKQDEVFAGADAAECWMYDSRIGRRWEIDPLVYTEQSPYACFNNNPIYFADPNGLEGEGEGDGDGDGDGKGKNKGGGSDLKNGGINGVKPKMPDSKPADPSNNNPTQTKPATYPNIGVVNVNLPDATAVDPVLPNNAPPSNQTNSESPPSDSNPYKNKGIAHWFRVMDAQMNRSNEWSSWDVKYLHSISRPVQTNFGGYMEVAGDYSSGTKNNYIAGHPDFFSTGGFPGGSWLGRGKLTGTFAPSTFREILDKFSGISETSTNFVNAVRDEISNKPAIQKMDDKKVVDTIYLKWTSPNGEQAYKGIMRNAKGDSVNRILFTGEDSYKTQKYK